MIAALLLAALFPLAEGARWIYSGTTRGDYHRADVVRRVETTMRVLSHRKVGRFEVVVVEGAPSTVGCDPVPEARRLFTTIIRDGALYYEVVPDELATEAAVKKAIEDATPFLELPLHGRKTIGCEQADHPPMYCWTVEALPKRGAYRLVYRSNPTLETMEFVEGVGITRWQSVHHGSPCEIDLRLKR
ncbi:MAG TPA: hypothetical protein VJZ76_13775 [Thermoanaerobaculia bacterium]|nr:hypothetical protein [Thermoanaerobaculia bacterium]